MLYAFRRRRIDRLLTLYVALCRDDVDTTKDNAPDDRGPAVMALVTPLTPIVLGAALFNLQFDTIKAAFRDGFRLETVYVHVETQAELIEYCNGLKWDGDPAWWPLNPGSLATRP